MQQTGPQLMAGQSPGSSWSLEGPGRRRCLTSRSRCAAQHHLLTCSCDCSGVPTSFICLVLVPSVFACTCQDNAGCAGSPRCTSLSGLWHRSSTVPENLCRAQNFVSLGPLMHKHCDIMCKTEELLGIAGAAEGVQPRGAAQEARQAGGQACQGLPKGRPACPAALPCIRVCSRAWGVHKLALSALREVYHS